MADDWGHLHVRCGDGCKDIPGGHREEYEVVCWTCEGFDPRKVCATCRGKTAVVLKHCPSQFRSDAITRLRSGGLPVEVAPGGSDPITDVLRAHRGLKRGFLPVDGGYFDQTRTFLAAVDWIERINAFHEKQDLEKVKRNSS